MLQQFSEWYEKIPLKKELKKLEKENSEHYIFLKNKHDKIFREFNDRTLRHTHQIRRTENIRVTRN